MVGFVLSFLSLRSKPRGSLILVTDAGACGNGLAAQAGLGLMEILVPRSSYKTFDATLERSGDRLNWTVIRVPFDVARIWRVRGQLKVQGEINGFAFRTSLFPDGKGSHVMIVNRKMQAGGRVSLGGRAKFRLEPDTEVREVAPPPELLQILGDSKRLRKFYEAFNHSMRQYMSQWVAEPKSPDARRRRAEQIAERLLLTMGAERDLPPILQAAFAQNPIAREGWERMPPGHRRSHLMGIFGYRSPESRARRLARAVEEMLKYARKALHKGRAGGSE